MEAYEGHEVSVNIPVMRVGQSHSSSISRFRKDMRDVKNNLQSIAAQTPKREHPQVTRRRVTRAERKEAALNDRPPLPRKQTLKTEEELRLTVCMPPCVAICILNATRLLCENT